MKILQQPVKVKRHSRVHVHFSKPTTVYLMTDVNFKRYKEGASFKRLGGKFEKSPAEFVAPYDGTWHAVIERGSHYKPISIEGRVEVFSPLLKDTPFYEPDELGDAEKSTPVKKVKKSKAKDDSSEGVTGESDNLSE